MARIYRLSDEERRKRSERMKRLHADPEFAAGVAAQRIVEAAYESARTGVPAQIKN